MSRDMLGVDGEMGGLQVGTHSLLQLGIIAIKDNKIVDELDLQLRIEPLVVTQEALRVNKIDILSPGITTAKEAKEIYMKFMNKNFYSKITSKGYEYVKPNKDNMPLFFGHNVMFDRPWLKALVGDFDYCYYHSVCTMVLAETMRDAGKLPGIENLKLETLCTYLKVPKPENNELFHNALVDIKQTFLLYQRLKEFIK